MSHTENKDALRAMIEAATRQFAGQVQEVPAGVSGENYVGHSYHPNQFSSGPCISDRELAVKIRALFAQNQTQGEICRALGIDSSRLRRVRLSYGIAVKRGRKPLPRAAA